MHRHVEVYLDESGDLGLSHRSSRHFIVVAVAVSDPKEFRRLVKRVQSAQYRHVENPIEFKFHSSPDRLRRAMCAGWQGIA